MKKIIILTVLCLISLIPFANDTNYYGYQKSYYNEEKSENTLSQGTLGLVLNDINTKSESNLYYKTKLNKIPMTVSIPSDTENNDDCAYIDLQFIKKDFSFGVTLCSETNNSQAIYFMYYGLKVGFNFGHGNGGVSYYGDYDKTEPENFFIAIDSLEFWQEGMPENLNLLASYNGSAFSFGLKYNFSEDMRLSFTRNTGGDYLDAINNDDYDYSFAFEMDLKKAK